MTRDDYLKMGSPWAVVRAAAVSDAARDAAVSRIIDTMLDLQMVRRHDSVGYQPFSVTGNVPMPGTGKAIDQAMIAAERYHPTSEWHRVCGWLLDRLPKRQAAAMLLQAARVRPDKMGESDWMVTAAQMVERQGALLQLIGYRSVYLLPGEEEMAKQREGLTAKQIEALPQATAVRPFESVRALQECASRARNRLREWIAQESRQAA